METLETYLKKLAAYEHTPPANLIAPWDLRDVDQIHVAFDDALNRTQISLSPKPNTTLSKLGNQIEKSFSDAFQKTVVGYNLLCCKGPGYPDRRLEDLVDARLFAFEIKAKTEFDLTNTARMVLTCGTRKLRRNFPAGKPLCHLLLTILYSLRGVNQPILIKELRFDFLQPWTPVEWRYEASTTQRLLAKGNHPVRHAFKMHCISSDNDQNNIATGSPILRVSKPTVQLEIELG